MLQLNGYSKSLSLSLFPLLTVGLLACWPGAGGYAQIPDVAQEEEILPEADPLKVDRFNVEFLLAEGMHFLATENESKALDSFLKAHQIMPGNAAVNYMVADMLQRAEEYDQALFYITKATQSEPGNYYYQAMQAEIYRNKGDLPSAIETLEKLYKYAEDAPDDYLLELAALYIYNGQPNKALATYEELEKRVGILEEVSTQKQKIYLKQNNLKMAIAEGKKLAEAFPNIGAYAVSVAQILISNGKQEEAIAYLEEYLSNNPNQALAQMELAKLYRQTNQYEKALPYFENAFSSEEISLEEKLNSFVALINQPQNSSTTEAIKGLGRQLIRKHDTEADAFAANGDLYFALNKKDSALHFYEKAINLQGDNFQLWQNLLALHMEKGNYQQVAEYAEEAETYFPNQPVLYLYAGSAYFSLKKFDQAIMQWEQGKSIVFGNNQLKSTFAGQLGDAYHAKKQYEKSFNAYEEAISANPQNYFAINNYTYYLALQKQKLERARDLSKRLIADNPENATFLDTHAWVLFQLGDYQTATKILEKAVQLQASGTIVEHYGDALFKSGKEEQAVEQWQRAKQMGGASKVIDKKISQKKYYEDPI